MLRTSLYKIAVNVLLCALVISPVLSANADSGDVPVSVTVQPSDATSFTATGTTNGTGECDLTWTTSTTPNVDTQRLEIDGPQALGVSFTTQNLPFPGTNTGDNITISNLLIDYSYVFRLVSIAGAIESAGVWAPVPCTPTSNLPKPIIQPAEPATTPGTINTISFINNGVVDGVDAIDLECNVRAGLSDFAADRFAASEDESGWIDCKDNTLTYTHQFTGLNNNTRYYYDIQSRDNDPVPATNEGKSPYSDVETSVQVSSGTGGGSGGGGTTDPPPDPDPEPDPSCGDDTLDAGEECDDGNNLDGDGCSAVCTEELHFCSDGVLDQGEECDDGNLTNWDGCSSVCEDEDLIQVTFTITAEPEHRAGGELDIPATLIFNKDGSTLVVEADVALDVNGYTTYQTELTPGTYDIGINGISHLTKMIYDIELTQSGMTQNLDYTNNGSFKLKGGDAYDDNVILSSDVAQVLVDYRKTSNIASSDITGDGIVNSLDIALLLQNYRMKGDQ